MKNESSCRGQGPFGNHQAARTRIAGLAAVSLLAVLAVAAAAAVSHSLVTLGIVLAVAVGAVSGTVALLFGSPRSGAVNGPREPGK